MVGTDKTVKKSSSMEATKLQTFYSEIINLYYNKLITLKDYNCI